MEISAPEIELRPKACPARDRVPKIRSMQKFTERYSINLLDDFFESGNAIIAASRSMPAISHGSACNEFEIKSVKLITHRHRHRQFLSFLNALNLLEFQ
ncbi:hypothetical protein BGLA2_300081 [Burkholderia gladioli]|nr:hypothetical protein BGLA2_300081 [Burkholderia gladioli]